MNPTRTIHSAELGLPGARLYFLAGDLPPAPRLAVIGSRAALGERLALLPAAISALGQARRALVSGGALGVDAAAHRAALARGLPQLAVLPCAADRPYPSQHVPIFRSIAAAASSGLLFCHPTGAAPCRNMFASRNAIVVGLAQALLVVEAQERSGSLGTGRLALKRRIPVAAVLGSPGCAALVALGARPLPCAREDFASAFAAWLDELDGATPAAPRAWPPALTWLAEALQAAGPGGIDLDDLEGPGSLHADLLAAQRLGLVVESPRGVYRRVG